MVKNDTMNFTLFFPILSLLNFSFDFEIKNSTKQAFLYFSSENCSAYLFRVNNEVYLETKFGNESSFYQTTIADKLHFSWKGFVVNDTEIQQINSTMNFTDRCCLDFKFTEFSILSPILDFSYILPNSQSVFSNMSVNYGYIVAIVFCVGLMFSIKPKLLREHFSKLSNKLNYK